MYISSKLVERFPSLQKYKPGVEFLSRLFFLVVLALVLKKVYWAISDRAGTVDIPVLAGFNALESLRSILVVGTAKGLSLLGYDSFVSGWIVGIKGQGAVSVQTPCLGINVCLVFLGLIIAYPSAYKWWQKSLYLLLGVFIIQFVNLLRMIAMVLVVSYRYELPIEHHDLFNMVIYSIIFGLFYWFINRKDSSQESQALSR